MGINALRSEGRDGTKWFTLGYNGGQNIVPIGRQTQRVNTKIFAFKLRGSFLQSCFSNEKHLAASFKCRVAQLEAPPPLRVIVVFAHKSMAQSLVLRKQMIHVGGSNFLGRNGKNLLMNGGGWLISVWKLQ